MAKVTSKLQVTIPKALAERYGIRPGDDIEWQAAGEVLRIVPPGRRAPELGLAERLQLFDEATERQRARQAEREITYETPPERGWRREDLYTRGGAD